MEEGDYSVEQSVKAEAQEEAPALQNVSGSATPAPPTPQFPVQFAQQMARNMPTQAQFKPQWHKHSLQPDNMTN